MNSPLVTTEWLASQTDLSGIFLLDVSVANVVGKTPISYDQLITIPNSYKVSVDSDLSNTDAVGVHVFPTEKQIQSVANNIGFNTQSTLVLYDDQGIYSSPRAWWIFKSFGFEHVFILDGGLPKWRAEGRMTDMVHLVPSGDIVSEDFKLDLSAVKTATDLLANIETEASTVVDVRAADRFFGRVPEPRPGVRSGHIPKSSNLPFLNVLTSDSLTFKSQNELKALFETENFNPAASYIFSCGSGMTACIMLVAAVLAGYENVCLYDGSWAEWGADRSLPVEV